MTGDEEEGEKEGEETQHSEEEVRLLCDFHVVSILRAKHVPQL